MVAVSKEEETGAGIHLESQRDVGKFVLRSTKCVHAKYEISMMISINTMRVGQCATNIKTATDEPVKTIAAGCLIHKIGVEGKHYWHCIILIVKNEAVAQVELDAEMVGGEGFEGSTIHETDGTTDGIVVRGDIAANLSHRNRAGEQS